MTLHISDMHSYLSHLLTIAVMSCITLNCIVIMQEIKVDKLRPLFIAVLGIDSDNIKPHH